MSEALLLIDVQQGFDDPFWGERNNPDAEMQMERLLSAWREQGKPVLHVQHGSVDPVYPLYPSFPGHAFKPFAEPLDGEAHFKKNVNSAFIGTGLEDYLREQGIEQLVIAGLTTDHCVSTTARMAGNLGFSVVVVADACATFDRIGPSGRTFTAEEIHHIHLASLHGEFCTVKTTDAVLRDHGE